MASQHYYCQALAFILFAVFVQAQEISNEIPGNEEEEDECSATVIGDYNMPMRIGSLFIIMATSAIGVFTPVIIHRIKPYDQGSIRDWLLTIGKFFGTGVILATAFIHMLPEALSNFDSPCLTEGWKSYGAFAGVFCMISSFALQLLELAAVSNLDRIYAKRQAERDTMDIEKTEVCSTAIGSDASQSTAKEAHDHDFGHVHSAGLLEDDQSFRNIGTLMLELGIVMHSIIIGITLANTGNDEFITLLIALVFHQFFEGVALGTRVNDMNHSSWLKPALMGGLFMIMTPIGVAIGIGIHSSFNANSSSSILASAILDSLSAGILLYNAYVSLMSLEINHNVEFRRAPFVRKAVCFLSMYVGAAIMALIGKWA
ncbi:Zinc/iron permease [Phycomyces nitens]|nr:Zinc/iron permease [Phycomyces nitens]